MKRSPLTRSTPLRAGAVSLERGGTFRRRRPKRSAKVDRFLSVAWARPAWVQPCAMCGGSRAQAHHIITQQQLRRANSRLRTDVRLLLWDDRNRLALCERCHQRHHSRSRPVTWLVLERHAPGVFEFAAELGLTGWLQRTYRRSVPDRIEVPNRKEPA